MSTWFTSDQHYGHTNILGYCGRPFDSVTQMNEALIERHNERVGKTDHVYFLGDVAFYAPTEVMNRLNGRKFLILGNHDERWKSTYHRGGWFGWIKEVNLVTVEDQTIWLSHYSHQVWPHRHHGAWHLFGHSHGSVAGVGKSLDVGVDCWDYAPVSFEQIRDRFAAQN
jgi:calcineurin-like phosphoesterase family protein